ncbi:hypothetical protein GFK82_00080 [Candidatus Steffania adelgidicola]|nr:hypothetical protein GFK82_00080 [Candidatus Steffania adelgidicola]
MIWLDNFGVALDSQSRIIAPEYGTSVFQPSNPKIFVGGDIVHGSDLVVMIIAEGCKVAKDIVEYLTVYKLHRLHRVCIYAYFTRCNALRWLLLFILVFFSLSLMVFILVLLD